jgi:hypothetical protein
MCEWIITVGQALPLSLGTSTKSRTTPAARSRGDAMLVAPRSVAEDVELVGDRRVGRGGDDEPAKLAGVDVLGERGVACLKRRVFDGVTERWTARSRP